MVVGRMPPDTKPRVDVWQGEIAIWAEGGGNPIGLSMSPLAAIDTGLRMLALATERMEGETIPVQHGAVELLEANEPSETVAARISIELEGARFNIDLGADAFVALAASCADIARRVG